ncbi:hypothetical protein H0H81_001626 [Sphagnurus paluster]|uniref:Major facilitator superfamily (MFS) profile domain-containing protein n=1 Tax=Sphagnurus paluster TaxID=117069 RepID=A0A9P7GJX8_9AGAR|nr:hypothetical protein H0H81_001626 [Sphagnurus paluster]
MSADSFSTSSKEASTISDEKARSLGESEVQKPKILEPIYDEGWRAWATLIGATCALTATFGYINAFGVYQDFYTRAGVASASSISWVGSTQLFFAFLMGLPAGKLLDMGYFRQTIFTGSLLFVFSLFMVSLAHHDQYYQIYLPQGLGMGIGAGLVYLPCLAIQSHHWRRRRALAMGITVSGAGMGGIIFPIMLNQLFESSLGFAWSVRVSGFLVLGLLILGNVLMCTNPTLEVLEKPKLDIKGILADIPFAIANFA